MAPPQLPKLRVPVTPSAPAGRIKCRHRRDALAVQLRRTKTNEAQVEKQKEPRASTTDPEARSVKMADGGFRPAYNLQIVCEPQSQVVVAVDVDTTGSDLGMARRGLEQLAAG